MIHVSRRIGIALETNFTFRESIDPRSRRDESRWLFVLALQNRNSGQNGHCADADAPSDGKPQHGPCSADPHSYL